MSPSRVTKIPEKNYYKILGVNAHASPKEIKAAYIRLAKIFHPDTALSGNQQSQKIFQDIAEAYKILSDRQKRKMYDRFGVVERKLVENEKKIITSDFFREILRNTTDRVTATVSFLQAIRGGSQMVKLKLQTNCRACQGVREVAKSAERCKSCEGRRKIEVEKQVQVTIPENLKAGQTVDIPSPLDPQKTLRISFSIAPCSEFRQEGFNVHSTLEVSLGQALLGDNVKLQGVYGTHTVRIPPGIQSNTVMKLPGKGIRKNSTESGDHYLTVIVVLPRKLTKVQMELIRKFSETEERPKP